MIESAIVSVIEEPTCDHKQVIATQPSTTRNVPDRDTESYYSEDQSEISSITSNESQIGTSDTFDNNQNRLTESSKSLDHVERQIDGVVMPNHESVVYGKVNVERSENVHLGSRVFYKGPVTVNQYLYGNSEAVPASNYDQNTPGSHNETKCCSIFRQMSSFFSFIRFTKLWKTKRWTIIGCIIIVILVIILILNVFLFIYSNDATESREEVTTLLPVEVPSVPKQPLQVYQTAKSTILVSWRIPDSDGGVPIEKYIVETKDAEQHFWLKAANVNASILNVTLKNLEENHEYHLRIYAKNKIGFSRPLESDKPFLIEALPRVISRKEWKAEPPTLPPEILEELPAPYAIICSTLTGACYNTEQCISRVKLFQENALRTGHDDIADNFLVGGDGKIYEGRGWNVQGNHTVFYNNRSISISFIGDYFMDKPTQKQLESTNMLLESGLELQYLTNDYKLLGQGQLTGDNQNPGYSISRIIQYWKHYSSKP